MYGTQYAYLIFDFFLSYSAGQQNMTNLVVPELDFLRENGPWIRSQGG